MRIESFRIIKGEEQQMFKVPRVNVCEINWKKISGFRKVLLDAVRDAAPGFFHK